MLSLSGPGLSRLFNSCVAGLYTTIMQAFLQRLVAMSLHYYDTQCFTEENAILLASCLSITSIFTKWIEASTIWLMLIKVRNVRTGNDAYRKTRIRLTPNTKIQ